MGTGGSMDDLRQLSINKSQLISRLKLKFEPLLRMQIERFTVNAHTHVRIHNVIQANMHMLFHSYIQTQAYIFIYNYIHIRAFMCVHKQVYACMNTYTYRVPQQECARHPPEVWLIPPGTPCIY
jgi:hypothetical protein